jgi:transposase InsO family protein
VIDGAPSCQAGLGCWAQAGATVDGADGRRTAGDLSEATNQHAAPKHRIYPYLLRDVVIDRASQVCCTNITYISMRRGLMYLVAVMNWASGRVLSWRVSNNMGTDFCIEVLEEAKARHGLPEIFNTDQGGAAQGSVCAARGMAAEGANSRARASRACWTRPASGSVWMAWAAGWIACSVSGFGDP